MSRTAATLPAPPDRVWQVLSDPHSYGEWVVGSDSIRDADARWPAAGSKLHHRVGIGPLKLNDDTKVLDSEPQRRLVLQARARPLGTARVTLELEPDGDGQTRVEMVEEPGDRFSRLFHNPVFDWLMTKRNEEALARLGRIAGSLG